MQTKLSIETQKEYVRAVQRVRELSSMLAEDFRKPSSDLTGQDIENATGYVAEMRSLLAAMKRYW